MYVTETQLQQILQNPYFSNRATQSVVNYVLYRGHLNATVHTLRFNNTHQLNNTNLLQQIATYLFSQFDMNTYLLCSISYDLLLVDQQTNSYYIWRANSNARSVSVTQDVYFILTYANLNRIINNAMHVYIPDLDIHFQSSNVVVNRIISFVFSFVKV
jgi:hypothetical protein